MQKIRLVYNAHLDPVWILECQEGFKKGLFNSVKEGYVSL